MNLTDILKKKVIIVGEMHIDLSHKDFEERILEKYKPSYLLWEGINSIEDTYERMGKANVANVYYIDLYITAKRQGAKISNVDYISRSRLPFSKELSDITDKLRNKEIQRPEALARLNDYFSKFNNWLVKINPKRENYMANKIAETVKENKTDRPVMVIMGAKHVYNVTNILDNYNISYKVYLPKVSEEIKKRFDIY